MTRAQAAGSTVLLPSVRGRTGCLERRRHGCIDENLCAAYTAVGRSSRGREANIAASAASPSVRAGSRRGWLRLPCIGMRKHVQKVGRSSPPCPPHPCPRLLPIRTSPAAAVLSLHLAAPQVQLDRLLDWVSSTRRRRPKASERASRPCSCRAALQLAGGGASCPAATTCSGPPAPAPGLSRAALLTHVRSGLREVNKGTIGHDFHPHRAPREARVCVLAYHHHLRVSNEVTSPL